MLTPLPVSCLPHYLSHAHPTTCLMLAPLPVSCLPHHLSHARPTDISFAEAVERFNSNVCYSGLNHSITQEGLFTENKEKLINQALTALLQKEGDQNVVSNAELEAQFHALRRLMASKAGYEAFTSLPK